MALTSEQRETLNAAEQILIGLLRDKNETLMFSLHHGWEGLSVTYFTPFRQQHSSIWNSDDPTLAGKINRALEYRAAEDARPDVAKTARVARLRAELAKLTGENA